jgi:hypothetical protein
MSLARDGISRPAMTEPIASTPDATRGQKLSSEQADATIRSRQ